MSIFDIMQNLRRLHDTRGRLKQIVSTIQTLERAAHFNPRRDGDWDILGQRDNRMIRINRILTRVQATTAALQRASGAAPNRSRELSRLFMLWAQAYSDYGEGARQVNQAHSDYIILELRWNEALLDNEGKVQTVLREMRRHLAFYAAQEALFSRLKDLAEQVVRIGGGGAIATQALTYYQQFFHANNHCTGIVRNYEAGIARTREWQSALAMARRELSAWMSWSNNRRQVNRNLQSQRPPH